MKTLQEIKAASTAGADAQQTIRELTEYIDANPQDDDALTERGLLYWALGRRSLAINDYLAAIKLNPKSRAKQAIASAYAILNFYNKDMYNP